MQNQIAPQVMEERRRERLNRLTFFMSDKTPPHARFVLARAETLNLLAGFFGNSKWRTAWFVTKDAGLNQWRKLKMHCWFWWQSKVRRRNWEQINDLLAKEDEHGAN